MKKIIIIILVIVILIVAGIISLKCLYKSDLVITDVSVSINEENPSECTYTVRVKNQGIAPIKDLFYLCYSFDSLNICNSGSVANMNSDGETVTVNSGDHYSLQIYNPCLPPSQKLYFKIDAPEDLVKEYNENNNDFILTLP